MNPFFKTTSTPGGAAAASDENRAAAPGGAAAASDEKRAAAPVATAPIVPAEGMAEGMAEGTAEALAALPPEKLIERVRLAEAKLADIAAKDAALAADEAIIRKKMESGLTRPQALRVLATQRAFDEAIAKQWADRRPRLVDIIKLGLSPREERLAIRDADASVTLEEINAAKAWLAEQGKSAAATTTAAS